MIVLIHRKIDGNILQKGWARLPLSVQIGTRLKYQPIIAQCEVIGRHQSLSLHTEIDQLADDAHQ